MASDQREYGHLVRKKRSPPRFTPRDDTGINAFITRLRIPSQPEDRKAFTLKELIDF